jgi:hypothetical protein
MQNCLYLNPSRKPLPSFPTAMTRPLVVDEVTARNDTEVLPVGIRVRVVSKLGSAVELSLG